MFKIKVKDVKTFVKTERLLYAAGNGKRFYVSLYAAPNAKRYTVSVSADEEDRGFTNLSEAVRYFNSI
jgi:hypothetical protein